MSEFKDSPLAKIFTFAWKRARFLIFLPPLFWVWLRVIWGYWGINWLKLYSYMYLYNFVEKAGLSFLLKKMLPTWNALVELVKLYDPLRPTDLHIFFSIMGAIITYVALIKFVKKPQLGPLRENLSGVCFVKAKQFANTAKKLLKNPRLAPGIFIHPDIQIDKDGETEHISVFGTTGAGKTKGVLNRIYHQARERGDKICLWDVKGDFTESLAGEDDIILIAPWDSRSVQWDIAADIGRATDCEIIAESAIPDDTSGRDKGPFRQHARKILSAIMQCLWNQDQLTWQNLSPFLYDKKATVELLSMYETGRQVLSYFENDTPQSQATWSTLQDHAGTWISKAAKAWPEPDFSIRNWLKESNGSTLLVRYHVEHPALSASLCTMITSLLINQVIALPEDTYHQNPIWFIMDEMMNFPKVENLKKGITLARDRGGRFVVSAQDVTQLHPIYGKETTATIINQCNTQIWLRANDEKNAKIASAALGSQEELLTKKSESTNTQSGEIGSSSSSVSTSEELRTVPVVHPGQIMALQHAKNIEGGGAHGFFKMSGLQLVTELIWPLVIFDKKYPSEMTAEWVTAKEQPIEEAA